MNTLTKLALGLMGKLTPRRPGGPYCASAGLATVLRAWLDHQALSKAMGLQADHQLLLSQTVGRVAAAPG
jgi:hypothetical protein